LKSTVLFQAEAKRSTWNMLASPGLLLRQHCQFLTSAFSLKFFLKGINKNKGDCNHCRIISFLKMSTLKRSTPQLGISRCNKQTYLSQWSRVLPEKLTGPQLVHKFPAFYGTRRFIITFTSVRHLSLSCAANTPYRINTDDDMDTNSLAVFILI
jgi:hypothetical protein